MTTKIDRTGAAVGSLTDDALVAETKRVAGVERQAAAELLALLIEVERRDLHLALGYASMFAYCTRLLRLSEQAAYSRITAARTARFRPKTARGSSKWRIRRALANRCSPRNRGLGPSSRLSRRPVSC